MCELVIPLFHFDHLPTQVPKSPHCSQDKESAKILAFGGGGGYAQTTCLLQKVSTNGCFQFESVLKF